MLRIDDDAVFVIDWAPVPSLRRTKHKIRHGFHKYATVARIPDRGTHLNPCHTPVRANPEPDLVLPFISGRRPRGDIWHQERCGPENITRAATRARTRIRAGPGSGARPGPPGRPRSLSRPTRRSIARPHRGGQCDGGGLCDGDRRPWKFELHGLRDRRWGGHGWHCDGRRLRRRFRSRRGRRREREPADRGTAAATTPTP